MDCFQVLVLRILAYNGVTVFPIAMDHFALDVFARYYAPFDN